jgi:hypothetical protein
MEEFDPVENFKADIEEMEDKIITSFAAVIAKCGHRAPHVLLAARVRPEFVELAQKLFDSVGNTGAKPAKPEILRIVLTAQDASGMQMDRGQVPPPLQVKIDVARITERFQEDASPLFFFLAALCSPNRADLALAEQRLRQFARTAIAAVAAANRSQLSGESRFFHAMNVNIVGPDADKFRSAIRKVIMPVLERGQDRSRDGREGQER